MKFRFIIFAFLLLKITALTAQGNQNHNLAIQYYNNGDYEKAKVLFKDLFESTPSSTYYYRYYFNCLLALNQEKELSKLIKKQIKRNPNNPTYHVDLGYFLIQNGKEKQGKDEYDKVLKNLKANKTQVILLANAFNLYREYEYALKTYQRGKALHLDYSFSIELANTYKNLNDVQAMIGAYLDYIYENPAQLNQVKNILQSYLTKADDYDLIEKEIYKRIQRSDDNESLTEMLIWVLITKKDYEQAFRQIKALDKRMHYNGERIKAFAETTLKEQAWNVAIEAFLQLQKPSYGKTMNFEGNRGELKARNKQIIQQYDFTDQDLYALENAYEIFIEKYKDNANRVASAERELANLEAKFLHRLDKAISILRTIIEKNAGDPSFIAQCKIDLGDDQLMAGNVWDATLLYSQVDKQMKDAPLGEMARFKNAKLSYYRGDFDWAQAQLDVLKASTSELIANDALELSVFITDKLGLDSTQMPMLLFARADLLEFQNKDDASIRLMDSILSLYPKHALTENIYFVKSKIYLKQHQPEQAVTMLQYIVSNHSDLLEDDALFKLGDIYQNQLNQPEKAASYYEQIILSHQGSIYVEEARKRYRLIRGDIIN